MSKEQQGRKTALDFLNATADNSYKRYASFAGRYQRESGWLALSRNEARVYLLIAALSCGLLLAAFYGERINNERYATAARASAENELGHIRSHLEVNLRGDIQLAKGMVSLIASHPHLDQAEFSRAAKPLFEGGSNLRNIGAAPDMVIRLMYPLAGNEKVIGLDYRKIPGQYETADLARTSGQMILAGPLRLVQGGNGIVGRIPVFVEDGRGQKKFWGLISAVIDADQLYRNSGLLKENMPLEIAIRGKDGLGSQGAVFFGRPELFAAKPVLAEIALPTGSWQMAAVPRGGWPQQAGNLWMLRLAFLVIGMLVLVPFFALARTLGALSDARELVESEKEELLGALDALKQSKDQLAAILNATTESVFNVDRNGIILAINNVAAHRIQKKPQDILGKCAFDFFPPEVSAGRRENLAKVFREGKELHTEDARNDQHFSLNYYPIPGDDGKTGSVVVYAEDITERKRAEATLTYQKNYLAAILENEPECVKVIDADGKLLQMNAAGLSMLEAGSVEEVNESGLINFVMPDYRAAFLDLAQQVFAGKAATLEFKVQGKKGALRWLDSHATPLRNSDGAITSLLAVTRDITRRKEAEERLTLALRGSDLAITDWHIPSDTLYFGEGWTSLLGYQAEELSPHPATLLMLIRPEELQAARDALICHLKGETPFFEAEIRMHQKNGLWVWVLARGMVVERSADGRAVRMSGTVKNINARKQAEAEVTRLLQLNELLLNSAGDGIYGVDMNGNCTFINPAALAILGYAREEIMGKNQHQIFHHHHQEGSPYPKEQCPVFQTLYDGIRREREDMFIRKNGEIFPVQLTVTPMHENGQIVGAEVMFQDIARRKEMEQELVRLATTDYLTGVANRRHFIEQMEIELAHFARFGKTAAFLMMDIDHFKNVNDTYGHAAGDTALKHFADLVKHRLRRVDLLGRLGGEEFGILLPGSHAAGARLFADRLRAYVAETPAQCAEGAISFTISIGITLFKTGDITTGKIMERADAALYRAKENGRNRVELE